MMNKNEQEKRFGTTQLDLALQEEMLWNHERNVLEIHKRNALEI